MTVDYETVGDSALAGNDFEAISNTLTFSPGQTTQSVSVMVTGDTEDEGDERFSVQFSNASNADILDTQASGTIVDDDSARLSQSPGPRAVEGDSGTKPAVFTAMLSTPAAYVVSVEYEFYPGFGGSGAKAGQDHIDSPGVLKFQPGETVGTYSVQIIGDTETELDEVFGSRILRTYPKNKLT